MFGRIGVLRNVLFSFGLSRLNENYVSKAFEEFAIPMKLQQAGYKKPPVDHFIRMLAMLSYNNGGRSSAKDFSQFLDSRIDFIHRKSQEPDVQKLKYDEWSQAVAEVRAEDFNFRVGDQKFNAWMKQIKDDNTQPENIGPRLRNISASQLGFPEWLRIWQSNGGPGYMNGIYLNLQNLRKAGLEACVDDELFEIK